MAGVGAGMALLAHLSGYQLERIRAFLDPWSDVQGSGWHTAQGLIAVGSGGLFGHGLGNGLQKFYWVPNAHTDAIFAIIGEELGFVGCVGVLGLFAVLSWRGFLIAWRAPDAVWAAVRDRADVPGDVSSAGQHRGGHQLAAVYGRDAAAGVVRRLVDGDLADRDRAAAEHLAPAGARRAKSRPSVRRRAAAEPPPRAEPVRARGAALERALLAARSRRYGRGARAARARRAACLSRQPSLPARARSGCTWSASAARA